MRIASDLGGLEVGTVWTDVEKSKFFAFAEKDGLAAVLELCARGPRPEELCGVRWARLHVHARAGDLVEARDALSRERSA